MIKYLSKETIFAAIGGVLTLLVAGIIQYLSGAIYSQYEAQQLLIETLSSSRYLASAALGAGVTTIALMLTLLSMSRSLDEEFSDDFYTNIQLITKLSVATIFISVLYLQINGLPVTEIDIKSTFFDFKTLYYLATAISAVIAGLCTTITLLISSAVTKLMRVIV